MGMNMQPMQLTTVPMVGPVATHPEVKVQDIVAPKVKPALVKVTEEDRVAWMRQFLSALEQWKTFLDSVNVEPPQTDTGVSVPAPVVAAGTGMGDPISSQSHPYAVYAATAQVQQEQYVQQFQFWQQMRAHEAQRGAKVQNIPVPQPQQTTRFKDNFRPMRLCKHLVTLGFCRGGEQCTFAHAYEELHPSSLDLPKEADDPNSTSALAEQVSGDSNKLPDLRLKKKKELCGRFTRGYCSLGKVCSFAHGEDELNTVGLAVCGKVKTQLCRNWEVGKCIYGANCNNAHGEREIGTKRPPPELAPPSKRRREEEEERKGEGNSGERRNPSQRDGDEKLGPGGGSDEQLYGEP